MLDKTQTVYDCRVTAFVFQEAYEIKFLFQKDLPFRILLEDLDIRLGDYRFLVFISHFLKANCLHTGKR